MKRDEERQTGIDREVVVMIDERQKQSTGYCLNAVRVEI